MNKVLMYSVAGAALVLTGCQSEVMNRRTYVPAPKQETAVENVEQTPETAVPEKPAPVPVAAPVEYQPMTGVKSSGGVDSVPGGAAKAEQPAIAGGVYVVRPGDTLGGIARRSHVKLAALMEANHLDQNSARKLRVGQKLVIPGKSAKYSGAKAAPKKPAAAGKSVSAAADGTYTVQKGDNPYKIARKLKVRRSDLLKANNLSEEAARKLRVGQKLVIPGKEAAAAKTAASVETPAVPSVPAEPALPAEAASAAAATPAAAAAAAPAADAPAVPAEADAAEAPGPLDNYEMAVVPDQEIKAADFAARHGMTLEELRKVNPGMKDEIFHKDQMIFVRKK